MGKKKSEMPPEIIHAVDSCNSIYRDLHTIYELWELFGVLPTPAQNRVRELLDEINKHQPVIRGYWESRKDSKRKRKELEACENNEQVNRAWYRAIAESLPEDKIRIEFRF